MAFALLSNSGLAVLKLDTFIDDAVFLDQIPCQVTYIDIRHTSGIVAEQEQIKMQLLFFRKQGTVNICDFSYDCFRNCS